MNVKPAPFPLTEATVAGLLGDRVAARSVFLPVLRLDQAGDDQDWPDAPLPEDGESWIDTMRRHVEEARAARRARWSDAEKGRPNG